MLKVSAALCILAAALAVTAYGVIYKLQQSNDSTITVNQGVVNVPVNLTPASSTINEGQQVQLTALVANPNCVGKTVHFMEGTTEVGTGVITDVGGGYYAASLVLTPSPGVHTYHTAAEA